jgi:hypothetical protein
MLKRFLVLYHIPTHVMDEWLKTDEAERKKQASALMQEWGKWMAQHGDRIVSTEAAGKTKLANAAGIADIRNSIHMMSIVQAESHDAAAQIFKDHPQFVIPEASMEIMELRPMG